MMLLRVACVFKLQGVTNQSNFIYKIKSWKLKTKTEIKIEKINK